MKTPLRTTLGLLSVLATGPGLFAQQTANPPDAAPATEEEVIQLSPFEVTGAVDTGYQATQTLAGTRIRTDLKDVGSAISVITKDFLNDVGATDGSTLLQYTTNAEVAGTRGTYAGLGNGTSVDETANLRQPGSAQRVRGLASADNTRDFFVTDIPWDSYNTERVDIQRGPNSILFGLGSPAGIVNASTYNAEFRNKGNVEFRTGSYGTTRTSIDVNQELIDNVLAIRVDGLWNDQKFRQEPAFQDDKRFSAAVRFDPQLFSRRDFRTSLKVKFENGDIKANRARILPPVDQISPWFRPVDTTSMTGGMGKLVVNSAYDIGANGAATNPWLTSSVVADQQQPIWLIDGTTDQLYKIYGGYVNTGALNPNGSLRGIGDAIVAQRYSSELFGLASLSTYATNARLPNAQYGQFRDQSLLDPTVFDFYNTLIDGPTKKEWEKWNAYNVDFTQTAFDDRLAVQLTYDRQKYDRGGQALLGNPALNFDMLKNFQDLAINAGTGGINNPNFGRPYVIGGPGGGQSYESDRQYFRGSLFGEFRAADVFKNEFLVKLLGKQRFNGVYSDENYETENRNWRMYAHSQAWDGYWNRTDGSTHDFKDRPPVGVIYLGGSLVNASSAAGARIPGITKPVELQNGSIYHFANTWKNLPGVVLSDPWTAPANYQQNYDPTQGNPNPSYNYTQISNPNNYVGWNTNFQENLLRYDDGKDLSLLTNSQKSKRVTKSYAGSWQGFFWNDAIVPTLGWRYDEVTSKGATARPVPSNRLFLNLAQTANGSIPGYALPKGQTGLASNQSYSLFKDHSTAGGVVVHINKLLGSHDILPINVSLSYNKSSNFQVTDARYDLYGHAIGNPTGSTKDYGVLLSTKDDKYSFRALKYETSLVGSSTPVTSQLLQLFGNPMQQGLRFRNVFLYRMGGYTWDTREQTNLSPGQRYFWTPAYINSNGRPVADLNGNPTPVPSGARLETQAEADLHRDATLKAWNDIQKHFEGTGYFQYWGYTPTNSSALTDRATYEATLTTAGSTDGKPIPSSQFMPNLSTVYAYAYPATGPQGFTIPSDTVSKGYEFEFTANPLPNWRVSFNAAKTEAVRSNVGGAVLDEFITFMDQQMAGIAGDLRQFNGNYVPSNEIRQNWTNFRGSYTLLKLQENAAASELRKWRYNIVTNYSFRETFLKGLGVGAGYRWQDKVVIGYPVIPGTAGQASFDLTKPYYGPSEDALDLWLSYQRKITKKIDWRIQLNVYNVGKDKKLVPISVEPDGQTWAAARIAPMQEWMLTNSFSF